MLHDVSGPTPPRRLLRPKHSGLISAAWNMVISNTDQGVIILDAKDSIVYVNPAAARIEGISVYDSKATDKISASGKIRKIIQSDKERFRVSLRVKNDDSPRIFDVTLSTLYNKSGRQQGKVVVLNDSTEYIRLEQELEKNSIYDRLTGIYSKNYFMEQGKKEMDRLWRGDQSSLSVIMTDIDNFELINYNYGTDTGQRVLKTFAALGSNCIRVYDTFGRLDEDRFAIILPNTKLEDAIVVAGRITDEVRKTTVPTSDEDSISFSVSHGVASSRSLTSFHQGFERLYEIAKDYLNQSKDRGGNQVTFF